MLATNVGGPAELVREGRDGYLLPPREPAAWAQAIRRIAECPQHARELGRAGRERVTEAFGVDDHVQAVHGIYERALARASR